MLEWHPDDPYPQAAVEVWPDEPDEPGAAVDVEGIRDVEDRMVALFERMAAAFGAQVNPRDIVAGADESGDAAMWLYALASRVPMGQADRYAGAVGAQCRRPVGSALRDAVETVSGDG